ncbi:MAG: TRAP transporter substrate-binding protein [Dehalococcoidia bacterium]|nr:Monocarboxylate 2-oxoacid-binding periplasmic protein [Chloroflexota bacterium]MBT9161567.1 Monocarboxylate 2-oxoacid-binding periplasmic protein [Chloroflexota bacterium]
MKAKGLSRKLFGCSLVLLLAVSLVAAACPAPVAPVAPAPEPEPEVFEWRMQAFISAGHPLVVNSQDFFVDTVRELSGGRLIIHSHGAGEIVGAMETRDAVTKGIIEMGKWWSTFDMGVGPAAAILGTMPFGTRHEDYLAWYLRGGGKELMAEFYDPLNVKVVAVFVEAAGPALHMREPWGTLEELKGRKMRAVGLQAAIFARLGIGVVPMPGGEIYAAMEVGILDGAEWAGPILNKALGFHEPGPYMLSPGWHEPALFTLLIVNKDAWAKLPDDLKHIMEVAALATFAHYEQFTRHDNALALRDMLAAGAQIIRLSDEDLATLRATAMEVMEEHAAKSDLFRRVMESQLRYSEFMNPMREFDDF